MVLPKEVAMRFMERYRRTANYYWLALIFALQPEWLQGMLIVVCAMWIAIELTHLGLCRVAQLWDRHLGREVEWMEAELLPRGLSFSIAGFVVLMAGALRLPEGALLLPLLAHLEGRLNHLEAHLIIRRDHVQRWENQRHEGTTPRQRQWAPPEPEQQSCSA